jgi:hypothetical protein
MLAGSRTLIQTRRSIRAIDLLRHDALGADPACMRKNGRARDGLSRFEELSRREAARTAILYAFDPIEHDGEDLRGRSFLDRKAALARLLRDTQAGILLNEHIAESAASPSLVKLLALICSAPVGSPCSGGLALAGRESAPERQLGQPERAAAARVGLLRGVQRATLSRFVIWPASVYVLFITGNGQRASVAERQLRAPA